MRQPQEAPAIPTVTIWPRYEADEYLRESVFQQFGITRAAMAALYVHSMQQKVIDRRIFSVQSYEDKLQSINKEYFSDPTHRIQFEPSVRATLLQSLERLRFYFTPIADEQGEHDHLKSAMHAIHDTRQDVFQFYAEVPLRKIKTAFSRDAVQQILHSFQQGKLTASKARLVMREAIRVVE